MTVPAVSVDRPIRDIPARPAAALSETGEEASWG